MSTSSLSSIADVSDGRRNMGRQTVRRRALCMSSNPLSSMVDVSDGRRNMGRQIVRGRALCMSSNPLSLMVDVRDGSRNAITRTDGIKSRALSVFSDICPQWLMPAMGAGA